MPAASVRAAAGALTFLTRVPLGSAVAIDGRDVARGTILFPVIGAGVGAAVGGIAILLHLRLSALAAAGIALAAGVVLTGGMHIDALADLCDAIGATRDRALEIMRDSRVGAFGAAAIAFDVLLRAAALSMLLTRGGALAALVGAGALSRAASPPLAASLAYPRTERGPGSVLTGRVSPLVAALAVALALGIAVLAGGVNGLAMAGGVAVSTTCLGLVYRRWLGGATGDCLGATTEIGETVALLVAAAFA
jgi:adenosylcobinamide-GDP ribazoletransferase